MGIGFQFTIDFAFAMLRKRPRRGDDEHAAWEVSCSRFGPSISELSLTLPESSVAESKRRNGLTALAVGAVSAACIGIPLARSGLDGFGTWEYVVGTAALLVLVAVLSLLLRKALTSVVKESVLAVRGVGLQFTAEFDDGSRAVRFVDARAVRAVVMNEGIEGCGVHYYIAVIAHGRRDMELAFPHTRPRLAVAAPIFREIHSVMLAPSAGASPAASATVATPAGSSSR